MELTGSRGRVPRRGSRGRRRDERHADAVPLQPAGRPRRLPAAPAGRVDQVPDGARLGDRHVVAGLLVVAMVLVSLLAASGSKLSVKAAPGSPVVARHPFVPLGPGGEAVTDTFYFVHQPLAGDGSITVRVSSLTGLVAHRAGDSSAGPAQGSSSEPQRPGLRRGPRPGSSSRRARRPGSAYAALMVTGAHGVRMQYDYIHDAAGRTGCRLGSVSHAGCG